MRAWVDLFCYRYEHILHYLYRLLRWPPVPIHSSFFDSPKTKQSSVNCLPERKDVEIHVLENCYTSFGHIIHLSHVLAMQQVICQQRRCEGYVYRRLNCLLFASSCFLQTLANALKGLCEAYCFLYLMKVSNVPQRTESPASYSPKAFAFHLSFWLIGHSWGIYLLIFLFHDDTQQAGSSVHSVPLMIVHTRFLAFTISK